MGTTLPMALSFLKPGPFLAAALLLRNTMRPSVFCMRPVRVTPPRVCVAVPCHTSALVPTILLPMRSFTIVSRVPNAQKKNTETLRKSRAPLAPRSLWRPLSVESPR